MKGSDHRGAAGPVAHRGSLSSEGASRPAGSAGLSPALLVVPTPSPGAEEGDPVPGCGASWVGCTLTPPGVEARGPRALLSLPLAPPSSSGQTIGPVVPAALAILSPSLSQSLSLSGWVDKGCSFLLISLPGPWHLHPHRCPNQRPGRRSHLNFLKYIEPIQNSDFSRHSLALADSAPPFCSLDHFLSLFNSSRTGARDTL